MALEYKSINNIESKYRMKKIYENTKRKNVISIETEEEIKMINNDIYMNMSPAVNNIDKDPSNDMNLLKGTVKERRRP